MRGGDEGDACDSEALGAAGGSGGSGGSARQSRCAALRNVVVWRVRPTLFVFQTAKKRRGNNSQSTPRERDAVWWRRVLSQSSILKLRRGLVKLTMCSAVGLDERYEKKKKEKLDNALGFIPWRHNQHKPERPWVACGEKVVALPGE